MKITTIRLTEELDNQLTEFARKNELSKNQVVKKSIRELLEKHLTLDKQGTSKGTSKK